MTFSENLCGGRNINAPFPMKRQALGGTIACRLVDDLFLFRSCNFSFRRLYLTVVTGYTCKIDH